MEDPCFATAREMAAALRAGEISARELTQAHLERIDSCNGAVNAVVTVTAERALAEAAAADQRFAAGEELPPLHGIPMAHKDTHATAGIRTTKGSPIHADDVPEADELVIERLKQAGAITLGKTNVPEFGAGSHTFNPVFGATRNPYDLSRSAGGSTGGGAAALACGMHALADGSDMGGSLRNPASFCNVVGLRPAAGRVPTYPDEAAFFALSVRGPMARTVSDVALLLSVMAGPDPRSPIAIDVPGSTFDVPLDRDLTGLRVAWSPDLGGMIPVDAAVTAVLEPQVRVFEQLGATVERADPDLRGADEVFRTLRAWFFAMSLGSVLGRHRDSIKATLVGNIEEGKRLSGADVARAEILHSALYQRMRVFYQDYDLLALPVSQVPPFPVELEFPTEIAGVTQGSYIDWMRSAYLITAFGHPALSVPAGFTPDGLPVGLQLVGAHRGELALLQAAHGFEQATRFGETRPGILRR
ncbi:amidase [Pseudonocardia pini]|uniref:amidase n=1 Tax=Pseudonocardia pini TaxID=2758030 RepID=UPI0015F07142|nr:amidase [Pseudonocardia pini]